MDDRRRHLRLIEEADKATAHVLRVVEESDAARRRRLTQAVYRDRERNQRGPAHE